jgi:hypothetical protein
MCFTGEPSFHSVDRHKAGAAEPDGAPHRCDTFKNMLALAIVRHVIVLASVLLLLASQASGQDGFRITYEVDTTRAERARVTGRIVNERREDVFEVSVTGEALDAKGKVLARGIAYVDSKIARGDGRPFAMSVPTVAGTANYRVVVSSFRAGFSPQAPGTQGP